MSKQKNYDEVTKIYDLVINKKIFKDNLSNIVINNITKKENETIIINKLIKKLSKNGYIIISIDPLKIEHQ